MGSWHLWLNWATEGQGGGSNFHHFTTILFLLKAPSNTLGGRPGLSRVRLLQGAKENTRSLSIRLMGCCRSLGQWLSPNTHCQGLHRAAGTSKGWQNLPWWPGVKLCVVTGRGMWTLAQWGEEIWEPRRKATWICWRFTTSYPLQYSRLENSMDREAWRYTNTHREGNVSWPSTQDIGSPSLLAALRSLAAYRVPSQQTTWVLWWGKELIIGSIPWRVEAHQRKKSFHKHTDLSLTWIVIKLICS